jgi:hypothetical protein
VALVHCFGDERRCGCYHLGGEDHRRMRLEFGHKIYYQVYQALSPVRWDKTAEAIVHMNAASI